MNKANLVRDIKIGMVSNQWDVKLNTRRKCSFFYFLKPKSRIVNKIINSGAILTGSRGLKCYKINGKDILDRKPRDWDFVVNHDILLKLCDELGISDFSFDDKEINVTKCILKFDLSYSGGVYTYVLPTKINFFVYDELPVFNLNRGVRVMKLENIIEEKSKLSDEKHKIDLNKIFARFHNINN